MDSAICPASGCRPSTGSARAPASSPGARPRAVGRSRRATSSSRRGCAGRLRCSTTPASIRSSGSTSSNAKRTELRRLPALRHAVAAGEPLNPEIVLRWQQEVGVSIHDGYGQTETGALTGMPIGEPVRPGSMGRPLPGVDAWIDEPDDAGVGELCVDPKSVPTFFLDGPDGAWRTGDRVREDPDGYLWFEGRTDDVIISAGYRIGPFEVESALVSHPAVAEAAAVSAPDEERGQVVRAVVVLRDAHAGSPELARELQDHVKARTAPYKYPRLVEFADALPKTPSGKIRRAELRGSGQGV